MPNVGPGFYKKLLQVTSEVGMKPEDLLNVMAVESGIDPTAHNSNGDASGLVQFMPSTLKAMGFKGGHADFRQLSAEQQLDYVKGLIKNMMSVNGGPFTSAAQYYVGNFLPIALKLPGIKAGDPETIIVAKNPDKPHLPGISTAQESRWYKANPALDADKDGLITYKDIQSVLAKAAAGKNYQSALVAMKNVTGYEPSFKEKKNMFGDDDDLMKKYISTLKNNDTIPAAPSGNFDNILDQYIKQIAASEKLNKKLYKKFLPSNNIVICVASLDYTTTIEFARILCATLDEELLSRSYTHTNEDGVEIECAIPGPRLECLETVKQLTGSVLDAFKSATTKIGNVEIKTQFIMDKKSSYRQISFKLANTQHRKFLLKFI